MTSCPGEAELVGLVDGALDAASEETVLLHLATCAPCRLLLGRSEAALRYALGGVADTGGLAVTGYAAAHGHVAAEGAPPPRGAVLRGLLVAGLAAACAFVAVTAPRPHAAAPGRAPSAGDVASARDVALDAELDALLADTERLRSDAARLAPSEREILAAGALAAAESRTLTADEVTARRRLADVAERFDGTAAAREAARLLVAAEHGR